MASKEAMKAWLVQSEEDGECYGTIVFAETASKAKSEVANTDVVGCVGYIGLRAVRAAKFDGRQDDPPTMREMVERHGWQAMCAGCGVFRQAEYGNLVWDEAGEELKRCGECVDSAAASTGSL